MSNLTSISQRHVFFSSWIHTHSSSSVTFKTSLPLNYNLNRLLDFVLSPKILTHDQPNFNLFKFCIFSNWVGLELTCYT